MPDQDPTPERRTITEAERLQLVGLFTLYLDLYRREQDLLRAATVLVGEPPEADGVGGWVSDAASLPSGTGERLAMHVIDRMELDVVPLPKLDVETAYVVSDDAEALIAAFKRGVEYRETTSAPVPDDRAVLVKAARAADVAAGRPACEHCGCTENAACEDGCAWVSIHPPICTRCAPVPA